VDIVADIGATHTRCALVEDSGSIVATETFDNSEHDDIEHLIKNYLQKRRASDRPSRAALAVAAPILEDHVQMTNRDWSFSQLGLQASLGLRRLLVINDFEALAWGLADFDAQSRTQIGSGKSASDAAFGVLGPGSGLGVAGLVRHADGWLAVGGEGGHVTLAATNDEEAKIIAQIRAKYDHCSAERVLSGAGLVNLYSALSELSGGSSQNVDPSDVTSQAQRGEPLAAKAMEHFFGFLGTVASDLALTLGARGGLYIAGGIVPQVLDLLKTSSFRQRFERKGRYHAYVRAIPTFVITEPTPAFRGLRRVLGFE